MEKDNFYNFVAKDIPLKIRKGDNQATFMLELQNKIDQKLWKASISKSSKHSPFLRTLHAQWRKVSQVLKNSNHIIPQIIQQISQIKNVKDIVKILQRLHQNGVHPLFHLQFDPDIAEPQREILYLRINDSSFSDQKSHKKYTMALFEAFNVPHPRFPPHQIDMELTSYRPPRHDLQSVELCYNPYFTDALPPELEWLPYYFENCPVFVDKFSIDSVVYFQCIGKLLVTLSLEEWKAYLMFYWLHHTSSFFLDTYLLFFHIERPHMDVSRKDCTMGMCNSAWWQDAGEQFIRIDRLYFQKCREQIQDIAQYVRKALVTMFKQSRWTPSTKKEALKKLSNMIFLIGWSDEKFDKYPSLNEGDYFDENILKGWRYQYKLIAQRQNQKTQRNAWRCTGYNEVNAFYSRELNVLFLPASLFAPPFFTLSEKKVPENFAAIGAIIGHEIYHGFDYDSRKVTSQGTLKNWWSPTDNQHFLTNAQKTIALYSSNRSILGSKNINGRLTLSENIADIVALQMAWYAFEAFYKANHQKITLEESQRFFRMFALSQIQVYSKFALKMSLETDYHALAMARVNVPLSIFEPFLDLYQIRTGDPMFTPFAKRPEFIF